MAFSLLFEVISLILRHEYMGGWDIAELTIRYTFTALFLAIIIWQCSWIKMLNQANSELIDKMYKIIIESRERLGLD